MSHAHWLLKTEPETYSFEQLLKDKKTHWNGVRNFQARNHLKKMTRGDLALIYHSGKMRSVVGIAKVIREFYPDPDPEFPGEWVQVDIEPVRSFSRPVSLAEIKASPSLKTILLVKQSRLSVMPISEAHYEAILKLEKRP